MSDDHELLLLWRYNPQVTPGLRGWFEGVEAAISRALEATANGRRWAGMFGNGKVQVACTVVDPDRAVKDLLAALGTFGPQVASPVIAVRDGQGYRVVFPPEHSETFVSMWGVTPGRWGAKPAEPGAAPDRGR